MMAEEGKSLRNKKPVYLKGRKPIRIKLHDVMHVMSMIDEHNQKEEFLKASREIDAYVTVHAKTVNFVKDFIASHDKMSSASLGARVMVPMRRDDQYECKFG